MSSAFGAHHARTHVQNLTPNASSLLAGIEIPNHSSFNGISDSSSSSDCDFSSPEKTETSDGREEGGSEFDVSKPSVKLHLKHQSPGQTPLGPLRRGGRNVMVKVIDLLNHIPILPLLYGCGLPLPPFCPFQLFLGGSKRCSHQSLLDFESAFFIPIPTNSIPKSPTNQKQFDQLNNI
ncbi:hypothetical protein L1887_30042 [Cichorium endivia]|nr:hypothetical protein L1887_30042 [Cichorium endivia]